MRVYPPRGDAYCAFRMATRDECSGQTWYSEDGTHRDVRDSVKDVLESYRLCGLIVTARAALLCWRLHDGARLVATVWIEPVIRFLSDEKGS